MESNTVRDSCQDDLSAVDAKPRSWYLEILTDRIITCRQLLSMSSRTLTHLVRSMTVTNSEMHLLELTEFYQPVGLDCFK